MLRYTLLLLMLLILFCADDTVFTGRKFLQVELVENNRTPEFGVFIIRDNKEVCLVIGTHDVAVDVVVVVHDGLSASFEKWW